MEVLQKLFFNLAEFDATKSFGHFLLLFFRILFFWPYLKIKGSKPGSKRVQKVPNIFWGVFWIKFLIFFAFFTSKTSLNQIGGTFCEIWFKVMPPKFLVTFYCCFFFVGQMMRSVINFENL